MLPTAPKASRDFDDFTDKIPKDPPYCAYLSNLPYDVDEEEIAAFFNNMKVIINNFYEIFYFNRDISILNKKYEQCHDNLQI